LLDRYRSGGRDCIDHHAFERTLPQLARQQSDQKSCSSCVARANKPCMPPRAWSPIRSRESQATSARLRSTSAIVERRRWQLRPFRLALRKSA
jgi:hypothetical protein